MSVGVRHSDVSSGLKASADGPGPRGLTEEQVVQRRAAEQLRLPVGGRRPRAQLKAAPHQDADHR